MLISNFCHDTNHYHLVRLYDVVTHTHTAYTMLPFGSYFFIRLQQWLNACLAKLEVSLLPKVGEDNLSKAIPFYCISIIWRLNRKVQIPAHIIRDIMLVRQFLVSPIANEIWSRPIGLLISRSPYVTSFTDIPYDSLGGFIVVFILKWRISSDTLTALGWSILTIEPEWYKPLPGDKMHINVLKFLTVFINSSLSIKILWIRETPPGGWIFKLLYNNNSALG